MWPRCACCCCCPYWLEGSVSHSLENCGSEAIWAIPENQRRLAKPTSPADAGGSLHKGRGSRVSGGRLVESLSLQSPFRSLFTLLHPCPLYSITSVNRR